MAYQAPACLESDKFVQSAVARIRTEYLDMPGLKLTRAQVQRLFQLDGPTCDSAVTQLVAEGFLRSASDGLYIRFERAPAPRGKIHPLFSSLASSGRFPR